MSTQKDTLNEAPGPDFAVTNETEDLKAERVQESLAAIAETHGRLKAERVQELLKAGWQVVRGGWSIRRILDLPDARVISAYAAYVTEHAAALRLPVEVQLTNQQIVVTLQVFTRRNERISDSMLGFAGALG